MFKSSDDAYMKPSCLCNTSVVFGRGYGILLTTANDLSDPSGLEMVNIGHAHSELFVFLSTPYLHKLLSLPLVSSLENVDVIRLGMEWILIWVL